MTAPIYPKLRQAAAVLSEYIRRPAAGDRGRPAWARQRNVLGCGIGLRETAGQRTADLALRIYVREKLSRRGLEPALRIPHELMIDGLSSPVAVDIAADYGTPQNGGAVAQGGSSIHHFRSSPGTLGCLLRRKSNPEDIYLLSNAHVIADLTYAQPGDRIVLASDHTRTIGRFAARSLFQYGEHGRNLTDAAIARVVPGQISSEIEGIGLPTGDSNVFYPGMFVALSGANSGRQNGIVTDVGVGELVEYTASDGMKIQIRFVDQIKCAAMDGGLLTRSGDSGAAVLNGAGQLVGLHFWGNHMDAATKRSMFNRFTNVLQAFGPQYDLEPVARGNPSMNLIPADFDFDTAMRFAAAVESGGAQMAGPPVENRDRAIDILARTLWGEARGEDDRGQRAVAAVIVNRANLGYRGDTIEQVCRSPSQFSCWNPEDENRPKLEVVGPENAAFAQCLAIAKLAVDGKITDETGGARHYHTIDRGFPAAWGAVKEPVITIGAHRFYNDVR